MKASVEQGEKVHPVPVPAQNNFAVSHVLENLQP